MSHDDDDDDDECGGGDEDETTSTGDDPFAMFWGTSPPDYPAGGVLAGQPVPFPNDGPNSGDGITRTGAGMFLLSKAGTYEVAWHILAAGPAQTVLTLNGVPQPSTVATSPDGDLSQDVLVTVQAGTTLQVINPPLSPTPLVVIPASAPQLPAAETLTIKRLARTPRST